LIQVSAGQIELPQLGEQGGAQQSASNGLDQSDERVVMNLE